MTSIVGKCYVPPVLPSPIAEDRFIRNGRMLTPASQNQVARGFNTVCGSMRKMLFCWAQSGSLIDTPGSASEQVTRFACRTGENVSKLVAVVGMAKTGTSSTTPGSIEFRLDDSGSSYIAPRAYMPLTSAATTFFPSDLHWALMELTTADGIAANTLYRGRFYSYNYARPVTIMVYEVADFSMDSSVTGVCNPRNWEQNKPIYDAATQELLETGTVLWRHNATPLFSWGYARGAPVSATSTAANIFSSSFTAWNANAPGFRIDNDYHGTNNGNVPLEFGIYCTKTAGTGTLTVDFLLNGSTLYSWGSIAGSGTPLETATTTHAALSGSKVDVVAYTSDGSTTFNIDCLAAWEYEA